VILSGVMMFDFLGWKEAARMIESAMERTIQEKKVTYDFERLMDSATKVKTSEFADHIIRNMDAAQSSAAD
jgi:isocitrate dehydrogenase